MREPFPLVWPESWTRTLAHKRTNKNFVSSYAQNRKDVKRELERMKGANVVVSSNIPLNSNGIPDARSSTPSDPGVAVWWMEKGGVERVIACDRWRTPGENLRAIVKSLEALRGITRWGASQIVDRAFAGFTALPAAGGAVVEVDWWVTLEIEPALFNALQPDDLLVLATSRYRKLAGTHHPDQGGTHEQMMVLNAAMEAAKVWRAGQ